VPIELKIRVNSPGAELAAGPAGAVGADAAGGALGAAGGAFDASGEFIALNICVKLPGSLVACAEAGGGTTGAGATGFSASTAGKAGGVCPAAEIFSIGTGLKTFASSSDGRETASVFAGSVVFSACSIRVNSPCCCAGAGPDAGVGVAAAAAGGAGGAGDAAGGGSGLRARDASRSSSSREGAAGMVPKTPVALDCEPPGGSSEWGSFGLSERSLNGSMRGHHASENLHCSGIQDYIALA
jgi:hypothetical protein